MPAVRWELVVRQPLFEDKKQDKEASWPLLAVWAGDNVAMINNDAGGIATIRWPGRSTDMILCMIPTAVSSAWSRR
jgi:hypothetical protein